MLRAFNMLRKRAHHEMGLTIAAWTVARTGAAMPDNDKPFVNLSPICAKREDIPERNAG